MSNGNVFLQGPSTKPNTCAIPLVGGASGPCIAPGPIGPASTPFANSCGPRRWRATNVENSDTWDGKARKINVVTGVTDVTGSCRTSLQEKWENNNLLSSLYAVLFLPVTTCDTCDSIDLVEHSVTGCHRLCPEIDGCGADL